MYSFTRVTITKKLPHTRCLKQKKIYFLAVLETRRPTLRCWQGWLLKRPLSLACQWPSSPGLRSLPLCVCVLFSSFKDTSHTGLGPTHRTSFYFISSKYSHILRYWESGFQQEFRRDTVQPITWFTPHILFWTRNLSSTCLNVRANTVQNV